MVKIVFIFLVLIMLIQNILDARSIPQFSDQQNQQVCIEEELY